ncbi:MAG: serine/threonine-protein kinase [Clostridium sp.]|uniref:serine/threonine-protein kinase n=1 Tax=Clostridium sp. TaxID=1506 RepID=UPI003F2D6442
MIIEKNEYKLQIYRELREIIKGKIYLVINEIDDKIYIKKILEKECYDVYKSLKELENKNRAKIKEIFIIEEKLYVIEEFINGENLSTIIENRNLKEEEILNIIEGVCNGLEDLHKLESPIIHRDIKPENIMINNDNIVKLIDFDAGRIVQNEKEKDTRLLGTRGYASPEQFGFAETDSRTDIYSLGVLLNYLLIKKYPTEEIAEGKFKEIIKKGTEIDREKRYKNVEEFKREIENVDEDFKVIEKFKKETKKDENIEEAWVEELRFEKEEKKKRGIIVGFRSRKKLKMILAIGYYLFATCGVIIGIQDKSIEDILVAIYLYILPTTVFGDISYLNKIFKKLNIKKYSIIIRVIIWFIVTLAIGIFMPTTN